MARLEFYDAELVLAKALTAVSCNANFFEFTNYCLRRCRRWVLSTELAKHWVATPVHHLTSPPLLCFSHCLTHKHSGHGVLGDKAACYAGKTLVRHLYTSSLRNRLLRDMRPEAEKLMHAAFQKGHTAALSLYDDPPKTINVGGHRYVFEETALYTAAQHQRTTPAIT